MQDVPVVEAEPPAGQPVVFERLVVEQSSDVEGLLGTGPHQGPGQGLLQLVQLGLVPWIVTQGSDIRI